MQALGRLTLVVLAGCVHVPVHAQESRVLFADEDVRVQRLRLPAGERTGIADHRDGLLVYLTADLEGRRPAAEAVWQPAGTTALDNQARTTFEAIFVELVSAAAPPPSPLPPEILPERIEAYAPDYYAEGHRVRTIVDTPRVLVTRHRLPPWQPRLERLHTHPRGIVLVYLAGGEMAGSTGRFGVRRVRRGDIDVLPAGTWHAFRNAGNDAIEFLMITPK
jgi:hypothetical protein